MFTIDAVVYEALLNALNNLHFVDRSGDLSDMNFISEDLWLADTAVIENLTLRQGEWDINLLFAHHKMPLRFLSRRITSQSCPKKAAMMAGFMRRLAAKDQRGTLRVSLDDLYLNSN